MKIFAGGISTETNTFSTFLTGLEDFNVQRGRDVSQGQVDYPALDLTQTWGQLARARGYEFIFSLMAFAQPAGITVRSAYEGLRDELLADLRKASPIDIVLLNLHGAMVAQGYDDCEEDIIGKVREIVGSKVVIGVELDLHCHLRPSTIACADVVITYKEYPHTDVNDRAREVFDLAVKTKLREIRPSIALVDCRMVGLYPTTRQPMRAIVDAMTEAERRKGVLSVSFGHGFQYADVPHVGAKMLVITDNDLELAEKTACEFAKKLRAVRAEIGFESLSLPLEQALTAALAHPRSPVVVADQSDNAGGGAAGDATFTLKWLLDHRVDSAALAIFYDPEVVRITKRAGVGSTLPVRLGGKLGPLSGDPIDLEVTVLAMRDHYFHELPQQSGPPWLFSTGNVVALHHGGIDIVVSSERCQCMSPSIFSDLGIDPKRKRLLIPKSYQHFYGAFAPIADKVLYMAAPGALPPDPRHISYRRFQTSGLYPWANTP